MTMSTSMPTFLVLEALLGRREQSDEGGHQDQEDDREGCKKFLKVGELAGWMHEGGEEGSFFIVVIEKRSVLCSISFCVISQDEATKLLTLIGRSAWLCHVVYTLLSQW